MKDKYCIKSVAPFHTINHSPTNNSNSKQTFSFGKCSRFDTPNAICPNSTYGGSQIGRRDSGASIGYGKKSDFTKLAENNPEGGRYTISSIFDCNKSQKKGASIGSSRQNVQFSSYIDNLRLKNPGIGRYKLDEQIAIRTSRAPAFSMGHKTKPADLRHTIEAQNKNPGPAQYDNNPQMSKTLFASHFRKTGFHLPISKRFSDPDSKVPGPSDYDNSTGLSNVGKYVMSSHKGGTRAKFDGAKRTTKFDESEQQGRTKPGPGAYRMPSQFGQYDGEVYGINK